MRYIKRHTYRESRRSWRSRGIWASRIGGSLWWKRYMVRDRRWGTVMGREVPRGESRSSTDWWRSSNAKRDSRDFVDPPTTLAVIQKWWYYLMTQPIQQVTGLHVAQNVMHIKPNPTRFETVCQIWRSCLQKNKTLCTDCFALCAYQ